jgi:hypothetical protein
LLKSRCALASKHMRGNTAPTYTRKARSDVRIVRKLLHVQCTAPRSSHGAVSRAFPGVASAASSYSQCTSVPGNKGLLGDDGAFPGPFLLLQSPCSNNMTCPVEQISSYVEWERENRGARRDVTTAHRSRTSQSRSHTGSKIAHSASSICRRR